MRKVKITISGGTAEEQGDLLRRLAWVVEHNENGIEPGRKGGVGSDGGCRYRIGIVEMAEYDRKLLAEAWYESTFGSHNALARAAGINEDRLALILLGTKRATVKELNAICEELNISVESVKSEAE